MKVMIACGGTGGHLFPGLAVAETLLGRGHTVKLIVSERTVEREVLQMLPQGAAAARLSLRSIAAIGLNGSAQALPFAYRFAQATAVCGAVCRAYQPQVVLGMGGYTAAPAVLAARGLRPRRTTTLIHESNAIPGKANRLAGRFAHHVALGLAECARFFEGKPVTLTGTPIRAQLRAGKCADAHVRLGLRADRATVLVMGGSQGAHPINEGIACALPWLAGWQDRVQFIHLSGAIDEGFVREAYDGNGFTARVLGFCHDMNLVYSAADLVLARAGAATLAEIAAAGLPALLVPYPHAAGDHQAHNARVFQEAGAARVFCQRELETNTHAERGERLATAISGLLDDPAECAAMRVAAQGLACADATDRIADLVEHCAQHRGSRAPIRGPVAAGLPGTASRGTQLSLRPPVSEGGAGRRLKPAATGAAERAGGGTHIVEVP